VIAGFASLAVVSPVVVGAVTAIYGLELLVAVVQAYVFTILTCVYLRDAVGGAHHSGPDDQPIQSTFHKELKAMEGDIAEMGKFIGAGLATIGLGGAGIGVGHIAGNFLSGALRNPSAAPGQMANLFVGIAFAEALGIFSFLIALLLMFAV
jgi:F-type H+-transporting ATPase subunit c